MLAVIIDEGHYGRVRLDGLRVAMAVDRPEAVRRGNGEAVCYVDERADAGPREALLNIMTGHDTDPFASAGRSRPEAMAGAGASGLETLLQRDRLITAAGLVVLCLLAWLYVLNGAGMGMSLAEMTRLTLFPHRAATASVPAMPGMAGMATPGMTPPAPRPDAGLWLLTAAMWWTMMIAMMTPAAAPAILIYARVHRRAAANGQAQALAPTGAFAAGYLLIWLGFSLLAASLQFALQAAGAVSAATMGSASRWFSAAVLATAGLYQLSPWQGVCLRHCRAPAGFLARHWRPGVDGALRLGAEHGLYCVGCCWLLMALLFVGGVMNLAWIAALTLLVLIEKILPGGRAVGRGAGVVMLVWALATAVTG